MFTCMLPSSLVESLATNMYKHVFVATKDVFCRHKSVLVAVKNNTCGSSANDIPRYVALTVLLAVKPFERAPTTSVDSCVEIKSAPSVAVTNCGRVWRKVLGKRCPECDLSHRTPSTAFRHLPPHSARIGYATDGTLFISAQLSTRRGQRPPKDLGTNKTLEET